MSLGKELKIEREQAGLSMEQIANASGISQSYISQIEANKKRPSMSALFKILKALTENISLDKLDSIMNIKNAKSYQNETTFRQFYFERISNNVFTYLSKDEIRKILYYSRKENNPLQIDEEFTFSTKIELSTLLNIDFSELNGVLIDGKSLSKTEFEFLQFVISGISNLR